MKKIGNLYDKFEEYLLVGSLAFNIVLVFIQVIMRSVFNYSLSWSEELSRYIFIWQTWLGASIALRYNEHIKVELIFSINKSVKFKKFINILANVVFFAFSLFLAYNGWQLTQSMISRNALSSGMRIPLAFVYMSLPISSVAICIRLIPKIITDIRNFNASEENTTIQGGNI